jgi:hypothetical protein
MTYDKRRTEVFSRLGAKTEVTRFREHVLPRSRAIASLLASNGHVFGATVTHPLPMGNIIVLRNLHHMMLLPKRCKGAKLSHPPKPKMRDSVTASMNPVSAYSNGTNHASDLAIQSKIDALRSTIDDRRNPKKVRKAASNELFMLCKSRGLQLMR